VVSKSQHFHLNLAVRYFVGLQDQVYGVWVALVLGVRTMVVFRTMPQRAVMMMTMMMEAITSCSESLKNSCPPVASLIDWSDQKQAGKVLASW
jgi:hypothetical protein